MLTKGELPTNSPSYNAEREKLPEELRPEFDSLVTWYRYFAAMHHNHPWVSYKILADLVRTGWRLSGEAIESEI